LRRIKSRSNDRKRQTEPNHNGYDRYLEGEWLTYYKVAEPFSHKAKVEDTEDLLHDIMTILAEANRKKPLTEGAMVRIASRCVADYWRTYYKLTNGLDCGHCGKAQKAQCQEDWLYGNCPKAIKLECLEKPILDSEGNLTELGALIADDRAMELDAWVSDSTWQIGYPQRLVQIACKLKAGEVLTGAERKYLCKRRKPEQRILFSGVTF
jgi:hypothetical protein